MPWCKETRKDVIDCDKLREAVNERYYPEMSEWGNPVRVMLDYCIVNKIAMRKITQGSETSQYLQENRTNVIPLVVASETGIV